MNPVTKLIASAAQGLRTTEPSTPLYIPLHSQAQMQKGGTRKQKVEQAIKDDGYDPSSDPYTSPGRDYLTGNR